MTRRDFFVKYLERFVGTPYRWGGDDPMGGFDCSGLVVEGLKAVGLLGESGDMSAAGMATKYPTAAGPAVPGSLYCFASKDTPLVVNHVGICIGSLDTGSVEKPLILEAGGGGSKTLTLADAIKQNAFIRVRPLSSILARGKVVVRVVDPFGGVA